MVRANQTVREAGSHARPVAEAGDVDNSGTITLANLRKCTGTAYTEDQVRRAHGDVSLSVSGIAQTHTCARAHTQTHTITIVAPRHPEGSRHREDHPYRQGQVWAP